MLPRDVHSSIVYITAAAPASEVEAVVRSPTNMAAAEVAAVDFNKMASLDRPACGHVCWERSASHNDYKSLSGLSLFSLPVEPAN